MWKWLKSLFMYSAPVDMLIDVDATIAENAEAQEPEKKKKMVVTVGMSAIGKAEYRLVDEDVTIPQLVANYITELPEKSKQQMRKVDEEAFYSWYVGDLCRVSLNGKNVFVFGEAVSKNVGDSVVIKSQPVKYGFKDVNITARSGK